MALFARMLAIDCGLYRRKDHVYTELWGQAITTMAIKNINEFYSHVRFSPFH